MMLFDRAREAADALRRAGREEIRKAHEAGVPAYDSIGTGRIVRELPDGTRQWVRLDEDGNEVVGNSNPHVPARFGSA